MKLALLIAVALASQHGHDPAPVLNEVVLRQSEVAPSRLSVLPGETVIWRNVSFRGHTVTSTAAGFDSGVIGTAKTFSHAFTAAGDFPYFCRIHPSVKGTIAVRGVLLDPQPGPVVRGEPFALHGRAAPGSYPVLRDGVEIATAVAGPDGRFSVELTATDGAEWRVGSSDPVRVEVVDRRSIELVRKGRRYVVEVSPPAPGARVVLQLRLRERFGWWPSGRARLDDRSTASFRVPRRRAAARVVVSTPAGVLGVSRTLRPAR